MKISTVRHVNYAQGYTALGLLADAARELDAIVPEDRQAPEVLLARVEYHWETKQWPEVVAYGRELVRRAPEQERGWIGLAYALRELDRVSEAKAVLLEAESLHGGTSAVLHYNLGCYHCLLGELADARARLRTAFRMHPPFKDDALGDRDLASMRDELRER